MEQNCLDSVTGRKSTRSNIWYERKKGPYTDDYGLVRAVIQTIQVSVVTIYALSAMLIYTDAVVITNIKDILKKLFTMPRSNISCSNEAIRYTVHKAAICRRKGVMTRDTDILSKAGCIRKFCQKTATLMGNLCDKLSFIKAENSGKSKSVIAKNDKALPKTASSITQNLLLVNSSQNAIVTRTNNTVCQNIIGDRIRIQELEAVVLQVKSEIREMKGYQVQKRIFDEDKILLLHQTINHVSLMVDNLANNLNNLKKSAIDKELVKRIVDSALKLYDEDKVGLADYALHSAGAKVISIGNTKLYLNAEGRPFHSPDIMLQPSLQPGHCWAFKGNKGEVIIQLSNTVWITEFTLEHTPKAIAPTQDIASAPKQFNVIGLDDAYISKELLGSFIYKDTDLMNLQRFAVQPFPSRPFNYIKIQFESNYGGSYTCVYRFRVHGLLKKSLN